MAIQEPTCPRCGYDLGGMIASWHDSCPLEATCSECGLVFECRRVLGSWYAPPRWSFEHALRLRPGAFTGTSQLSLFPQRLFAGLHLEHPIRPLRLVLFMAAWAVLVHLALIGGRLYADSGWWPWSLREWLMLLAFPYFGGFSVLNLTVVVLAMIAAPYLAMPLLMLTLGDTLSQAHVRRIHMLRGLAYSLPSAILLPVIPGVILFEVLAFNRFEVWSGRGVLGLLILMAWPMWIIVWWSAFLRTYLRLDRAWIVSAVLAIPTCLAMLAAVIWSMLMFW